MQFRLSEINQDLRVSVSKPFVLLELKIVIIVIIIIATIRAGLKRNDS